MKWVNDNKTTNSNAETVYWKHFFYSIQFFFLLKEQNQDVVFHIFNVNMTYYSFTADITETWIYGHLHVFFFFF